MFKTMVTLLVYMTMMCAITGLSTICNAQYAEYRPIQVPPKSQNTNEKIRPTAYKFPYDKGIEYGQRVTKTESKDGNGAIKGSYSYIDLAGVQRTVDYVAEKATTVTVAPENQSASVGTNIELELSSPKLGLRKRFQAQARAPPELVYKIIAPTQTPSNTASETTIDLVVNRLTDIFETARSFISNNVFKRLFSAIDLSSDKA